MIEFVIYSEQIKEKMHVTIWDNGDMTAKTESGTFYNAREMQLIKRASKKVPVEVHILKSVFGGLIFSSEKNS